MRILVKIYIFFFILFCCNLGYANVHIALVVPKEGNYKQQGLELINGVQKAVDEINNDGGVLDKKINLMVIDDQCNDSIAISTAQMLTILKQSKINLVIGPYCANSFEKVADIYSKGKIFQIIPTTVNYNQAKTIKKGLVKMLGYTNQQAKDFFAYYNSTYAGEEVAIISNSKDEESMDEAYAIINEFKKHGKSIILKLYTYDMTNKNYGDLAEKVINEGNTLAFVLGSPTNIKKMSLSLKKNDKNFIIFTNKYAATSEYFNYLDDLANGTYFMKIRGKEDNPDFAETLVKLRLSGFETDGLSLHGYSAVKLWANLVEKSKSFAYEKLSENINDKKIQTEFGNKVFHNGVPEKNETYSIMKYENGEYIKVY
jgi:branched-chain amino acid transport system substrate-binding protein